MRATVRTILLMVGIGLMGGVSDGLAAPSGSGADRAAGLETLMVPVHYWGGRRCGLLRMACIDEEELGDVGEGYCRRYHYECRGVSYCERLRRACIYKEERGEVGWGNCRRYRRECGGY